MNGDEIKNKVLEDYFKNASPDEIKELNRLLNSREDNKSPDINTRGLDIDVNQLAKKMSSQISRQMGMANLNIKKMSRDLVAQMARHYKPGISEKELTAIVSQMVPEKRNTGVSEKIPYELLRTMIVQFISYSAGTMSEKDRTQMPEGWAKKYWDVFSPDLRDLIKMYLENGIDNRNFWIAVEKLQKK